MKKVSLVFLLVLFAFIGRAQKNQQYQLTSPNNKIQVTIDAAGQIQWSVRHNDQQIIAPSEIAMELEGGETLGKNIRIAASKAETVNNTITANFYKKNVIQDQYKQLTLNFRGDYGIIFRAYNDGVAYRFFTTRKGKMIVKNEVANFNFTEDYKAYIPYMWDYRDGKIFNSSFEALYDECKISEFAKDSLAFLPLMVDVGQNKKVVILEADLEDYPGMYLDINGTRKGFKGVFAPYPLEVKVGGYQNMNLIPSKRADYIASTNGTRSFPWRAIVISENDVDLLDNDMVQKLASPSRIADVSWIKPGQVAWDWWNDWNITGVDFKAGMNTTTYKHYIDFASANHIKYIIIDWGWSEKTDLTKVNPDMNIQEIVKYGNEKSVGVILWTSWQALTIHVDNIFPLYAKMGVKGFKVDFIDRDDQLAVASIYEIAKKAANNKLLLDYHGVFKPTGLQKTYPNVVNYEGVKGLENVKWADEDAPRYAVSIPFIRMMAGPMDYTPGAMRNVNKANFRAIESAPMSKGTRCHQLAMYVIYEAPLQMLADSPVMYRQEQESTDFITSVPTTFDQTVALNGKVGEYVAMARRKGDTWYVGAMSNWDARTLNIDLSFLGNGNYEAVIFKDGVNADKNGTDYKHEVIKVSSQDQLKAQLASGGGWAARIYPSGSK
jgi:alpha-glucosidase